MEQKIIIVEENYRELDKWVTDKGKIFLVCDSSLQLLSEIKHHLEELEQNGIRIVQFSAFQSNPVYESVVEGVDLFHKEKCGGIMAIGGGSAMDVAKCIKLFSSMNRRKNYLEQEIVPNGIPFLAMPTTAGTGSEATRYAVIYYKGMKQSVTSESCIPETVLLDSSVLKTLPAYQKKSTMLDALCHAIESFWSVNSTEISKQYSQKAIHLIVSNIDGYLANDEQANASMLNAANVAGHAINITQTTAGHAMCYKVTSLFGCAHGHAAALCNRVLFPWMVGNTDKCIDPRGEAYLRNILDEIGQAMGCKGAIDGAEKLGQIFEKLELDVPAANEEQYEVLKNSVNPVRLKNHPIHLEIDMVDQLYHEILR